MAMVKAGRFTPAAAGLPGSTVRALASMYCGVPFWVQVVQGQATVPAEVPAQLLDVGAWLRVVDADPGRGAAAGTDARLLAGVHGHQATVREQAGDLGVGARGRLLGQHRASRRELAVGVGCLAGGGHVTDPAASGGK
jgi:hypothetical protein